MVYTTIMLIVIAQAAVVMPAIDVWANPETTGVSRIHVDSTLFEDEPVNLSSALSGAGLPGIYVIQSGTDNLLSTLLVRGGSASGTKVMFDGLELTNPTDPSFDLWLIPSFFVGSATIDLTARKSFYGTLELNPFSSRPSGIDILLGARAYYRMPDGMAFYMGIKGRVSSKASWALWAEQGGRGYLNADGTVYPIYRRRLAGMLSFHTGSVHGSALYLTANREIIGGYQDDWLMFYHFSFKNLFDVGAVMKKLYFTPYISWGWGWDWNWESTSFQLRLREFRTWHFHIKPSISVSTGSVKTGGIDVFSDVTRVSGHIDNGFVFPMGKAIVSLGMPVDAALDIKGDTEKRFVKALPFASLEYQLSNRVWLRAAYSHLWHLPNFYDLYGTVTGDSLKPEEGDEVEMGTDLRLPSGFSAGFTVYGRRMLELIQWRIVTRDSMSFWAPLNAGQATFRGLDFHIEKDMGHFSLRAGGSLIRARDKNGEPLPFVSDFASVMLRLKDYRHLYGNIRFEFVAKHKGLSFRDTSIVDVPAYTLGTVTLGWKITANSAFEFEIYNFANSKAEFKPGYPLPGRSYRFTLRAGL